MPQAPRRRTTRRRVKVAEAVAKSLITFGGLATIVAVTLIFVFLVWVVVPLFAGAAVGDERAVAVAQAVDEQGYLHVALDEYGLQAAFFERSGVVEVRALADGALISRHEPFGAAPTSAAFPHAGDGAAFGFADGSVRQASFRFESSFLPEESLDAALASLPPGATQVYGDGLVEVTADGKHRMQTFVLEIDEPMDAGGGLPIRLIDLAGTGRRSRFATLDDGGALRLFEASRRKNLLTNKVTYKLDVHALPYTARVDAGPPVALYLTGLGDGLLLVWADGSLRRLDVGDVDNARVVEERALLAHESRRLTAVQLMLGRQTLLVADDAGGLTGWFLIKPEVASTVDGGVFVAGHQLLAPGASPVVQLSGSNRSRLVVATRADGRIELLHGTTEIALATLPGPPGAWVRLLPKEDGLLAFSPGEIRRWSVDVGHPSATVASLFTPVWYEGYSEPRHEWQSSSASDSSEPKFGLYPLVYGTLKATFYSMLFGAPLALLAALFTSEFLKRRTRTPIKSTIEMMASLPSVVLGYLAGVVVAPYAAEIVPSILSSFVVVPATLIVCAHVWQLLPQGTAVRLAGLPRLGAIALGLGLGGLLAWASAPLLERWLFAGDLILWLDGQQGSALGGWFLLLLPLAGLAAALGSARWLGPLWRSRFVGRTRRVCALADLAKCLVGLVLTALLALGVGGLLTLVGLDPRDSVFGTFEARNTLVVGFVMGFAIIPIIYTLSEDALSSVPEHLRLASLGAGATPWQTAVRVIIPTATSGLFSALMIGLGRAVGETMIVLMATGNTAVIDWNLFNGFRTLSANIAVELPEAPPETTHYRTLFLAALVLFAMTFVLNTFAEVVRQRFRKRAFQL